MRTPGARFTVLTILALAAVGCGRQDEDLRSAIEVSIDRPDILIYLVDTLRPDRLGCYGYDRPTSPNIDAFAAEAVLFENAFGQSSWTRPSIASLFTGVWPPTHGATGWKHVLSDSFSTLAETLSVSGYQTAAFVGNPQVAASYGFDQGFDTFTRRIKRPSGEYNQLASSWLDSISHEQPWFLYIHTMDPHAPYRPPEPYLSQLAPNDHQMPSWEPRWRWPLEALPYLSDRYDGEIARNDSSFGEMLEILRQRGLYEDALIVFTSDHGEEFKEHGRWRHGENLHAPTLDIPLIMRFPRQSRGLRIGRPTQHIDLMPTILEFLELEVPAGVQGKSLLESDSDATGVYSHLFLSGFPLYYSVVDGDWKLIRRIDEDGTVTHRLYDRANDADETTDLAAKLPARVEELAARLDAKLAADEESAAAEEVPMTDEMKKELEALGYLQ